MVQYVNGFLSQQGLRAWRLLPVRQRRLGLSHLAALLAPTPDPLTPPAQQGIAVAGELSSVTGIGEVARLMLQGLGHLNVPVWPVDIPPAVEGWRSKGKRPIAVPPRGVPLVIHVNPPLLPLTLLRLERAMLRGRRVIAYWTWELLTVPNDWHLALRFVHDIWTPSQFTATAMETITERHVRVVPPPLAAVPTMPATLHRNAFGLPATAVIVLVVFNLASSFQRKNPLAAIAAFRAAFGDRKDRVLLLKISNPMHFPDDFATIRSAATAPNIYIETRNFPPADHAALIAACDIVMSLHRSEGLGLVPAQAMLLSKPVIVTGWSGNMDFMDKASAALVGYRLVPPCDARRVYDVPGSVWAEPDQREAVAQLRRLANDLPERVALGARGRTAVMARLGVRMLADAVRDLGIPVKQIVPA